MKTFTQLRNLYGSLINSTDSTKLTLGDQFINDGVRTALGRYPWPFLEKTSTIATVASQQFYDLPYDYGQLNSVTITVGTTRYTIDLSPTREFWDAINIQTVTSNIPQFFFIFGKTIGFFPIPSSSGNTITLIYKKAVKDLSIADYTTGTIASVAAAGTAVVGSGTTWTPPMAGSYLRITDSQTANKGDGFWYEIAASGSATTLILVSPYGGTAIVAGSAAYTIGQMPVLPENYHQLPVFYAASQYWALNLDIPKQQEYRTLFEAGLQEMTDEFTTTTSQIDVTIQPISDINANLYLRL